MIYFTNRDDNDVISREVKRMCKTCPRNKDYPECAPIVNEEPQLRVCCQDDRLTPPAAIETDWRYRGRR